MIGSGDGHGGTGVGCEDGVSSAESKRAADLLLVICAGGLAWISCVPLLLDADEECGVRGDSASLPRALFSSSNALF